MPAILGLLGTIGGWIFSLGARFFAVEGIKIFFLKSALVAIFTVALPTLLHNTIIDIIFGLANAVLDRMNITFPDMVMNFTGVGGFLADCVHLDALFTHAIGFALTKMMLRLFRLV